ncbi:MAG: hypothetical protein ACXWXS_07120 [Actinomycetota bacterium]
MADDERMPAAPGAPKETPPPATADEAAAAEPAEVQGSGEPAVDEASAERAPGEDERAADVSGDTPDAGRVPPGMAILVSVPFEIAKRIESFLRAHGIACEVQKVEVGPVEAPAKVTKPKLSAEPYDSGMRHAAKNLLKIRSTPPNLPDLIVDRDPRPLYDVLVLEGDLASTADDTASTGTETLEIVEGVAGELVVLCHLPWQEAWALAARLTDEGIPAVAVPDAEGDRETALDRRVVPVAVRPEDLEAARAALQR